MLIVPVKLLPFWSVRSSVEIVSTRILPSSVCASAMNSTCAPLLLAVPQPCDAELPTTRNRYPSGSSFLSVTPESVRMQCVFVM